LLKRVPFVIGQWVRGERFYGRRRLIGEVLDGSRDAIWVLGTRRIGKTSLLKQLEQLATEGPDGRYFPLFWDFQGADEPEELHAGFADALLDAEERLEELEISAQELEADDLFRSLARLRRKLRSKQRRLLLLCDEVEELIGLHGKDPALLRKLRHALLSSGGVRSVLASTIRLYALADQKGDTSPFLHGFSPPLYIQPLDDRAARALVRQEQLEPDYRPPIADADLETLCARCDNHPFLLQLVAKRLLETGDLDEAVEEVAADQMVSYFFSVDFDLLSASERQILKVLARNEVADSATLGAELALDPAPLGGALQNLQQLGFIRRNARRQFVLANYFFRRWLTDLTPNVGSLAADRTELLEGTGRTLAWPDGKPVLDGRYELRRKVGDGATGVVYEAYDQLLRTRVAVKLLRTEYAGNQLVVERFRQEILLARNLGHPNILRLYHLGQFEDRTYLTMQWIEGGTLARQIAEQAPLAEERVAFVGARLASALEAAHAHNVLHRDVKPQNIMLAADGEPLVTDFGLARLLEGPGVTTAGVFLGTPSYVSPEQAALQPLDERSDLYSLGVVLFEMATGRCPFRGDGAAELLEMHRKQPAPDPRDLAPGLSAELAAIILGCLEKERESRPATAAELRRALERFLPGGTVPVHSAPVVSRVGAEANVDAGPDEVREASGSNPATVSRRAPKPTADDLLPLVYDELRGLARGYLSRERGNQTLQPTALVHEAYLRLTEQDRVSWAGRTHFFAIGAKMMRRLLIDHARARGRQKRGGGLRKITLLEGLTPGGSHDLGVDELLSLDAALDELAAVSPRQAEIVEQRFFGGLTVAEVAEQLGVSKRTVEAEWTAARDWLRERLAR
jgi:RNA polymerase sigma factor (TIGR02999 family)